MCIRDSSDIARSRPAYLGFGVATWPFFRGSFIRADGLTSIRRSFTARELRMVLPGGWRVTREFPSRLVLRWQPPTSDSSGSISDPAAGQTGRSSLPPDSRSTDA